MHPWCSGALWWVKRLRVVTDVWGFQTIGLLGWWREGFFFSSPQTQRSRVEGSGNSYSYHDQLPCVPVMLCLPSTRLYRSTQRKSLQLQASTSRFSFYFVKKNSLVNVKEDSEHLLLIVSHSRLNLAKCLNASIICDLFLLWKPKMSKTGAGML